MGILAQAAGSFGGVGGAITGLEEMKKRGQLKGLSPNDVLQSSKKNLALAYGDVTRVKMGRKLGGGQHVRRKVEVLTKNIRAGAESVDMSPNPTASHFQMLSVDLWSNCLGEVERH